jgi:hypothetical protein
LRSQPQSIRSIAWPAPSPSASTFYNISCCRLMSLTTLPPSPEPVGGRRKCREAKAAVIVRVHVVVVDDDLSHICQVLEVSPCRQADTRRNHGRRLRSSWIALATWLLALGSWLFGSWLLARALGSCKSTSARLSGAVYIGRAPAAAVMILRTCDRSLIRRVATCDTR